MRIVSLVSAATEMLFALGLHDQVVGVSHECDWPPPCCGLPRVTQSRVNSSAASGAIDAEVKALLATGEALYEVDVEQLTRLQPDLIVTQSQCDVCAVKYEDVVCAVRQTPQLTTARVLALNPRSLVEVFDGLRQIGEAIEIIDRANGEIAKLQERVNRVRSTTNRISPAQRPRVAVIEWLEPLMLAGNWVPELVQIAGGRCDLTEAGGHSRYHQWSEIRNFDPEVIVVCPCGFDLQRARTDSRVLRELPSWSEISAVKNGRAFVVDGNACFNRPGPRLVESLELLAALLHPERIEMPPKCESLFSRFD
jgi:iron complex transport system substrate-binding protein